MRQRLSETPAGYDLLEKFKDFFKPLDKKLSEHLTYAMQPRM